LTFCEVKLTKRGSVVLKKLNPLNRRVIYQGDKVYG
jgi:hypothetical protein